MDAYNAVVLRDAGAADSGFIFDVHRQAFREYVELGAAWDDDHEYERHLERFGRHRFRVVVADTTDVGYMATAVYQQATATYPPGLYLHQLMILPAYQSRRIGSTCLRLVAAEARQLAMPLRFRVLRVNPRALEFYIGAGCEVVGQSDTHFSLELRM
jgi:ribosomal protein S18 acetylase RimI-like enzyme